MSGGPSVAPSLYTDEHGVERLVDLIDSRPSGTTIRNERGEWPGIQFRVRWEGSDGRRHTRWTVTFADERPVVIAPVDRCEHCTGRGTVCPGHRGPCPTCQPEGVDHLGRAGGEGSASADDLPPSGWQRSHP